MAVRAIHRGRTPPFESITSTDTGHALRGHGDPVKWIRELGNRVSDLHIEDVAEKQKRTYDGAIGSALLIWMLSV